MDFLIHFSDGGEAFLSHYGVPGMKWGVRHDKDKAFAKSMTKLSNLDAKAAKYAAKRKAYINVKTSMYDRKNRAASMQAKADRLDKKARKNQLKSAKALRKGNSDKYAKAYSKSIKYSEKATKLREKATGVDARSNKMLYKQQKYENKAKKWSERMNKEFGSIKMSASSQQKTLGKKYLLSMI